MSTEKPKTGDRVKITLYGVYHEDDGYDHASLKLDDGRWVDVRDTDKMTVLEPEIVGGQVWERKSDNLLFVVMYKKGQRRLSAVNHQDYYIDPYFRRDDFNLLFDPSVKT